MANFVVEALRRNTSTRERHTGNFRQAIDIDNHQFPSMHHNEAIFLEIMKKPDYGLYGHGRHLRKIFPFEFEGNANPCLIVFPESITQLQ